MQCWSSKETTRYLGWLAGWLAWAFLDMKIYFMVRLCMVVKKNESIINKYGVWKNPNINTLNAYLHELYFFERMTGCSTCGEKPWSRHWIVLRVVVAQRKGMERKRVLTYMLNAYVQVIIFFRAHNRTYHLC